MIYLICIALFSFFFLLFGLFYFGFKSHFETHAIFHVNWRGACAIFSQCFTVLQVRRLWNCMHECCLWYFPAQNFFSFKQENSREEGRGLVHQVSNESRLSIADSLTEFFDAQEVLLSASSSENEVWARKLTSFRCIFLSANWHAIFLSANCTSEDCQKI